MQTGRELEPIIKYLNYGKLDEDKLEINELVNMAYLANYFNIPPLLQHLSFKLKSSNPDNKNGFDKAPQQVIDTSIKSYIKDMKNIRYILTQGKSLGGVIVLAEHYGQVMRVLFDEIFANLCKYKFNFLRGKEKFKSYIAFFIANIAKHMALIGANKSATIAAGMAKDNFTWNLTKKMGNSSYKPVDYLVDNINNTFRSRQAKQEVELAYNKYTAFSTKNTCIHRWPELIKYYSEKSPEETSRSLHYISEILVSFWLVDNHEQLLSIIFDTAYNFLGEFEGDTNQEINIIEFISTHLNATLPDNHIVNEYFKKDLKYIEEILYK